MLDIRVVNSPRPGYSPMKQFRLRALVPVAASVLLILALAGQARAQSVLDNFDPNANGAVSALVVQPDGKILIGGNLPFSIARLNQPGTLDN